MTPKATIIIPTHQVESNREGNVLNLLIRLKKILDPDEYQVIVVCNNDSVATKLGIGRNYVGLIPGSRMVGVNLVANHGLSYAWNRGLKYAKGEYVFFVNHDLIITRDTNPFEKLIKEKERFEKDRDLKVFVFGVEGTRQSENPDVRMLIRYEAGQFSDIIPVDEVSGFLFGIQSTFLYEGFFDEKLSPCFYEEMDLCQKVRDQNKQLAFLGMEPMVNIIVPGVNYRHDFGVSAENPSETTLLWYNAETKQACRESLWKINRRNRAYLQEKWGIKLK